MRLPFIGLAAVAGLGLLMAQPAQASLMVTMTDSTGGSFHCVDNGGVCDFSGATDQLLTLNNTVGAFQVTGTISVSSTGLVNLLSLVNFGATNTTGAAATLNMWVSDTDFTAPVASIQGSAGILFSNAVGSGASTLDFFADNANTQGANLTNAPGTFLFGATQTPLTNPQQFLGNDSALFSDLNLFSMTEVAHINLIGGGSFTDFGMNMQSSPTPIPAALPLFATAVGGFGLYGRWRKRKSAALPLAA